MAPVDSWDKWIKGASAGEVAPFYAGIEAGLCAEDYNVPVDAIAHYDRPADALFKKDKGKGKGKGKGKSWSRP